MGQTGVMFTVLIVAFVIFITLRGELSSYVGVFVD
jgi:hypothetical protein